MFSLIMVEMYIIIYNIHVLKSFIYVSNLYKWLHKGLNIFVQWQFSI